METIYNPITDPESNGSNRSVRSSKNVGAGEREPGQPGGGVEYIHTNPARCGLADAPVGAFGAEGGATQYLFRRPIQALLDEGILEVVK